jgi:hypothetical protein
MFPVCKGLCPNASGELQGTSICSQVGLNEPRKEPPFLHVWPRRWAREGAGTPQDPGQLSPSPLRHRPFSKARPASHTSHYSGNAALGGNNYTPLNRSTPCDDDGPRRNRYDIG